MNDSDRLFRQQIHRTALTNWNVVLIECPHKTTVLAHLDKMPADSVRPS